MELTLICPKSYGRLGEILDESLKNFSLHKVSTPQEENLRGRRIIFAFSLSEDGIDENLFHWLSYMRKNPDCLAKSVAGVVIDGQGELYTKSIGREFVLAASMAGCIFPGRALVEGTGSLRNFKTSAKKLNCSPAQAYQFSVTDLAQRVLKFSLVSKNKPNILAIHASSRKTSNTLALWNQLRNLLADNFTINEIGLRNGTLEDCAGCPYTTCLHYGENEQCFYGGVIVKEFYPAIRSCDALMILCPNYNDALPANLSAAINRLTALYRTTSFADKAIFAIIVSGYSGSDIIATQIISALNMNKGFWLPSRFCLMETANDRGEAISLLGIDSRLKIFAENIIGSLTKGGTFS